MAISVEKTGKKGKEVTRNKKEIKGSGKKWQRETRKWMCAHLISLLWFFGRKKMKAKTPEEIKFAAVPPSPSLRQTEEKGGGKGGGGDEGWKNNREKGLISWRLGAQENTNIWVLRTTT